MIHSKCEDRMRLVTITTVFDYGKGGYCVTNDDDGLTSYVRDKLFVPLPTSNPHEITDNVNNNNPFGTITMNIADDSVTDPDIYHLFPPVSTLLPGNTYI